MKIAILIISLLVASSMQACCSDCTAAIAAGVVGSVLNQASNTMPASDHICASKWNATDGTCCDAEKLTEYWTTLSTEFETFKNKIKTEMAKVNMSQLKTLVSTVKTMVNFNALSNKFIGAMNSNQISQMNEILGLADESLPVVADLNSSIDSCHQTLVDFRKEALCYRCSGKASEWWDAASGSYLVNQKSCNLLIDKCSKVFALTNAASAITFQLRNLLIGMFPNSADNLNSNAALKFSNAISIAEAKKIISCSNGSDACLNDDSKRNDVCKKFTINLSNEELEGDYKTLEDGAKIMTTNGAFLSGISTRRRLLQMVENLEKIGQLGSRILTPAENKGYISPQATGGMIVQAGLYEPPAPNAPATGAIRSLGLALALYFAALIVGF